MTIEAHEGAMSTAIWRACQQDGHPIPVKAARIAAQTATRIGPPIPAERRPALMRHLHEHTPWHCWHNLGLLAEQLRRHADMLDRIAHDTMMKDAA